MYKCKRLQEEGAVEVSIYGEIELTIYLYPSKNDANILFLTRLLWNMLGYSEKSNPLNVWSSMGTDALERS